MVQGLPPCQPHAHSGQGWPHYPTLATFTCFSAQNGLLPFILLSSNCTSELLSIISFLRKLVFKINVLTLWLFFFNPFKIKQREQVINSATAFEKCHAVHLRDAFPNVKLYGCDVLEWKIPAILMFRTLYFFNTDVESLVKVSDPLFIKALALLA